MGGPREITEAEMDALERVIAALGALEEEDLEILDSGAYAVATFIVARGKHKGEFAGSAERSAKEIQRLLKAVVRKGIAVKRVHTEFVTKGSNSLNKFALALRLQAWRRGKEQQ